MNYMATSDIAEAEPVDGLPGPLPQGEIILWQGAPHWWSFALSTFHIRLVAAYFAVLGIWQGMTVASEGATLGAAVGAGLASFAWGLPAIGILCGLAWLVQRTTTYTITDKRLFMQIGVALPKMLNIPLDQIASAAYSPAGRGTGHISIDTKEVVKFAYLLLWPHARPWHFNKPQPLLRAVPDAANVAHILADALQDASGQDAVAAAAEAAEDQSAPPQRSRKQPMKDPHAVPARPLVAAALLVVFAVTAILFGMFTGQGTVDKDSIYGAQESIRAVTFTDIADDQVAVHDAQSGDQITVIDMTKDGLLRNALRAVRTSRSRSQVPQAADFQIIHWESGRVTLTDQHGGRDIPLTSFGPAATDAQKALRNLHTVAAAQ